MPTNKLLVLRLQSSLGCLWIQPQTVGGNQTTQSGKRAVSVRAKNLKTHSLSWMWESLTISVNLSTEPKSRDEEQAKNWRNMITNMPLSWLFFFCCCQSEMNGVGCRLLGTQRHLKKYLLVMWCAGNQMNAQKHHPILWTLHVLIILCRRLMFAFFLAIMQ